MLAQVAELDPDNSHPVRVLAERIKASPKLVERARTALHRGIMRSRRPSARSSGVGPGV